MRKTLLAVALLVLLASACLLGAPQENPAPAAPASETPLPPPPQATNTIPPSETPLPPSETPLPDTPTPSAVPTVAPPVAYGPDNFPPNVNPLTGLPVADPQKLERRPLGAKIEMFPRMHRPPWGVAMADIVYDYYQNNGMTRFHPIFYGQDAETVGPIRSARLLDGPIVRQYKSILAFGSADKRILSKLLNTEYYDRLIMEGAQNCPPMCRVDPNGANLLTTNTAELSKYVTAKGIPNGRQNLNGMSFNTVTPAGGQPFTQMFMRYSISAYNRWDYDPASQRYLRFQDTQEAADAKSEVVAPLTDRLTNQQISTDNVVVLFLNHKFLYKSNSGNSEIVEYQFDGSGDAIAFRDGQAFQVKWNRPKFDSVVYLTFPDGTPYPYKPGTTWYEVMGTSSKTENPGPGIYRVTFSIP